MYCNLDCNLDVGLPDTRALTGYFRVRSIFGLGQLSFIKETEVW
jgi:hypothetical protein